MKKLDLVQMENLQGSSNRQCLIDGALALGLTAVGFLAGGPLGGVGAWLTGLSLGNSNGCFDKK
ncbi:hypothetical protein AAH994_03840 [Weeksellaceae bacterium A-14]